MHADAFLRETAHIAMTLDREVLGRMARELAELRERKGRLFLIGLGGSAANCSHAAADFRNLCEIDARTSVDSMAGFSARGNDDGWDTVFSGWLQAHGANSGDALMVLSVGGGTDTVSRPISEAVRGAVVTGMRILGIVGPQGGVTAEFGHCVLKVTADKDMTPHTEAFQAVVWHLLVSHPALQRNATKW